MKRNYDQSIPGGEKMSSENRVVDVHVYVQLNQVVPFFILPAEGVTADIMLNAVTQAVISGHFKGDARCSAGMNILHYLAIQPDLLLGSGNLMLKFAKLLAKCTPNFAAQVRISVLLS